MLDKNKAFKVETKIYNSNSRTKTWYFYCECGRPFSAQSTHLKTHKGKCKSCVQRGKPYEAIYNELYRAKGLTITDLSYDDFVEMIKTSKCHYCNHDVKWFPHTKNGNGKEIKGARAYHCVPCCWTCNRLKSNVFTYEEFKEVGLLISKFRKNREDLNLEKFEDSSYEGYYKNLDKQKET